ncbi:hypothetical protein IFM89_019239 [Coptis chinensis]|uniref:Late embryogenesis abundant protein LEA-2 subgroup domain-containing protein n=1 Tax=Coptis chinensis TaxID=261450 RepID=A0A835HM16_9MAGN|nr:hypothetical protein IFM89_019239 [Coptis chinensis]
MPSATNMNSHPAPPPPPRHHPTNHSHQHTNNNHNQNRYHPDSSSSSASFKGCCCCLFLLLTFLGLLVLAVILVILLAVKPKKPQFELEQVNVQYVGITPTSSTTLASPAIPSASLSLTIRMVFRAVNPNKVGIKYSGMEFYVMYRGVPLGVASVHGFYQPAHSARQVVTNVNVDRVNLLQADATEMIKDASLNDRVELKVIGDVGAKIRILDFTSPRVKVSVDCAIVISPRKQSMTYKQCGVDGLTV